MGHSKLAVQRGVALSLREMTRTQDGRMRVAIVGAGVAGLVAAHHLARAHEVIVLEAAAHAGGHARTVPVELAGRRWDVDTGFVVYEPQTYPGFARLLAELGVATQPGEMSFGVRCAASGIAWSGRSVGGLLAQPGNLARPAFLRLLRDVLRFNRLAAATPAAPGDGPTVGAWAAARRLSPELHRLYLRPMAAAIWSARPADVDAMPADALLRFFRHHDLLRVRGQPTWRTVTGGASRYVDALVARLPHGVRLGTAVVRVRRDAGGAALTTADGATLRADRVVLAVPGSRALALLDDPGDDERAVLGAFREQENEVVLHTDASVMPRARRAWASWNVHLGADGDRVALTYDMARLQRLHAPVPLLVTLNAVERIAPSRVLHRFTTTHPVHDRAAIAAQARRGAISGVRGTHYCGAYWGFGFHEDGVASALAVCRELGVAA
jgi:predicted NAD/FAD-binding protein